MISFPENLTLEDHRALLRPLEHTDLQLLLPYALQEPETWHYSMTSPAGEEGMKRYIDAAVQQRAQHLEYPFIVLDQATNEYAGCTRFYDIQLFHRTVEIGYTWYGKRFRRTGLNRHCKWLMLSYAFESWQMERVAFKADARNEKSIRAMKDIGCTVEGILRSHTLIDGGGRRDSIILSILRQEWFSHVKDRLLENTR
jgi:N-acetyltransferase